MTTQIVRLARRQAFALAAVLALVIGMIMFAPTAFAQDAGQDTAQETDEETQDEAVLEPFTVSNAEFRWGINRQSSGPSHLPGENNYFAAGNLLEVSEPTGSSWKNRDGKVKIDKRSSKGVASLANWAGTSTDQDGREFSNSQTTFSGLEMVFFGGEGRVDPEAGTAQIRWSGTATVIYYSGLVRLSITDPILNVTPSRTTVTATVGGLKSNRETTSSSGLLAPKSVVIAEWKSEESALHQERGYSADPEYLGVRYTARGDNDPQSTTVKNWGSFPSSFVDLVAEAGSAGFWYSTGTNPKNDLKKVPEALTISWDSDEPADVPSSGGTSGDKSVLGQVIDDTIEDILRSAGTDVSDTAAAWMDEAWKPLQPDAVNAAKAEAEAAAAAAGATGEVVSQVDSVFEEYHEEYYSAGAPITAGTVAATVASIPASTSRSAAAPASAPAANSADQVTMQMAATSPLYGSDVVYAQTSASSEAGSSSGHWQWWAGAALLAIAAMLFFQTVRRKD